MAVSWKAMLFVVGLSVLGLGGCTVPPPEPEPVKVEAKTEVDKAQCSWLGSEVQVFMMNLEAGELIRTRVSLDGIANTANRMKDGASAEAARELEALRNASIDLKNWLDTGEGDMDTSFTAFEGAYNNVVKICNRQ